MTWRDWWWSLDRGDRWTLIGYFGVILPLGLVALAIKILVLIAGGS